jgi:hypothetical protein
VHHHALVKTIKPGEVYISKSSRTACVTVLTEWCSLNLTLPEWNEKFLVATTASDVVPAASLASIKIQEDFFQTEALNFKTPAEKKRRTNTKDESSLSQVKVTLYSPFFRADEKVPITNIEQVLDGCVGSTGSGCGQQQWTPC